MIIKIPSENYESLSKKIKALSNKADRLNLEPISMELNYSIGIATPDKSKTTYTEKEFYSVEVKGEPPVLSGWKFIGIVEPTDKGNVLIEINPENKIPEKYRHTDLCDCEHCGIKRDRLSAFIVENEETGEVLQVGRVCLKSYTSDTDPKNIALYESFFKLKEFERDGYGSSPKPLYNPEIVLTYFFKTREEYPELSRSNAKDIALNTIPMPYFGDEYSRQRYDELKDIRNKIGSTLEDKDYQKARDFILLINNIDDSNNNRVWNYKLVLNEPYTSFNDIIFQAVEFKEARDLQMSIEEKRIKEQLERIKAQEELLEAKKSRVHIGVEGEKTQLHVRLDSIKATQNQYGTTFIHTFRDEKENNITWFSSGKVLFDIDERENLIKDKTFFYIEATVGSHINYNDEPQTKILRTKFLGMEEPKAKTSKKLKV